MPWGVFKTGDSEKPWCVYRTDGVGGPRMGESLGCHPSEETARGQIQAIGARTHAGGKTMDKELWVTIEEMLAICPDCAAGMQKAGLKVLNLAGLKEMPAHLLRSLCDKFGADEGFFTRCEAGISSALDDPKAFCAWLHEQCMGKWPGEKSSPPSIPVSTFLRAVVSTNVGNVLEGRVHKAFTWVADSLFERGILSRDERIALSNAIGESLDALSGKIAELGLENRTVTEGQIGDLLGTGDAIRTSSPSGQVGAAALPPEQESVVAPQVGGLKALGGGWVGGCLVSFSPDGQQRDLVGDWFDKGRSNFHWAGRETRSALYHHGLDPTIGKRGLGRSGRGWRLERIDDLGLWVKMQLDMRNEYEAAIYKMTEMGKLGLSSGTANHLIVRAADGCLENWPIVEGSFTPTPMEPRAMVQPLRSIEVVPFKSLLREVLPGEVAGTRAASRGGRIRGSGIGRFSYRNNRNRKGAETMTIEELMDKLRALVSTLTDEQANQIGAVLRLAMGEEQGPPIEEMVEGEVTEEMRAAFGLHTWIDPYKAVNLDDALAVIDQVVSLTDEQREQVAAVLQLALVSMEEGLATEGGATEEEFEDEDEFEEELPLEEEEELEEIRAMVEDAVYGAMGESAPSPRRRRSRAVSRPPYAFTPSPREGGNPATRMQFGDTDTAVKAIAHDMYGSDYELKRFEQHRAFGGFLRYGKAALDAAAQKALKTVILTPEQLKAYTLSGMSVGELKTDMQQVIESLGGFTCPEDFRMDMIRRLPGMTIVRGRAETYTTGADMMTRVVVTGGDDRYVSAVRVTWVGDKPAAASADTNLTYGLERTPIHICKATLHVPMTLLEDTPFPLVQHINEEVARAYAIDEDEQFLIGDGIAKPEGMLPDSANPDTRLTEADSGSNSNVTWDGLIDCQYALPQQYWAEAVWMMNRSTAKNVRKLKNAEGDYLWEPSQQAGQPPMLSGYPVWMSEALPDIAQNAYPIIYGNVREGYQIADRVGMSVVRDDITKAEEDMVKFIFRRRLGGQVKADWALVVQKITT